MPLISCKGLTYGIRAPYAASLLPITTKLQKAAIVLKKFERGWFQTSTFSAGCVVGEGRSTGLSSSSLMPLVSERRRLVCDPRIFASCGLAGYEEMGWSSTGCSTTQVVEPELWLRAIVAKRSRDRNNAELTSLDVIEDPEIGIEASLQRTELLWVKLHVRLCSSKTSNMTKYQDTSTFFKPEQQPSNAKPLYFALALIDSQPPKAAQTTLIRMRPQSARCASKNLPYVIVEIPTLNPPALTGE